MTHPILLAAQHYAAHLPYAGELTPKQAHQLLATDPNCVLIDVRTQAERDWVGQVDISTPQHQAVQWQLYPSQPNPNFLTELSNLVSKETVLLFLCRSGARSKAAAQLATANGFTQCYDILEGFEGDKDALGHRKNVNGWCFAGLPWRGA